MIIPGGGGNSELFLAAAEMRGDPAVAGPSSGNSGYAHRDARARSLTLDWTMPTKMGARISPLTRPM